MAYFYHTQNVANGIHFVKLYKPYRRGHPDSRICHADSSETGKSDALLGTKLADLPDELAFLSRDRTQILCRLSPRLSDGYLDAVLMDIKTDISY